MAKRSIEIAVGFFILFGLVSLIVLALRVSGLSDIYSGHEGFVITADFNKVGGLKPRARVTIGGVQVGRVTSIRLNQEQENGNVFYVPRVTIALDKAVNNLAKETKAQILTAGLLGDNYIELDPGFFDEDENDLQKEYLADHGHIGMENTLSPIALEDIIAHFISSEASGME